MPDNNAGPASVDVQRCDDCGRCWQNRFAGCPYCGGAHLRDDQVEGLGRVYSWVEVERSLEDPPQAVPYTVVTVELDAGLRVFGRYEPGGTPTAGEPIALAHRSVDGKGPLSFSRRPSAGQEPVDNPLTTADPVTAD